jgi:3-keto-5-aminohexanoate cleavage enzyme
MALDDPVLIACAISGAVADRAQCPAIPYTAQEYAAEARRAVEEGASMVHIHARRPDGTPSHAVEVFRAITDAITAEVDVVDRRSRRAADRLPERVEAGRGRAEHALDELREVLARPARLRLLDGPRQPVRRDRRPARGDERARHQAGARVLRPRSRRLARAAGRAAPPLRVSCALDVLGGAPPTARNLAAMVDNLPGGSHWGAIGIARAQWTLIDAALALGGSIRVGLEDNFHLPDGEMARSNGDLVARARRMAEDTGRRVATVAETRALLSA